MHASLVTIITTMIGVAFILNWAIYRERRDALLGLALLAAAVVLFWVDQRVISDQAALSLVAFVGAAAVVAVEYHRRGQTLPFGVLMFLSLLGIGLINLLNAEVMANRATVITVSSFLAILSYFGARYYRRIRMNATSSEGDGRKG